MVRQRKSRALSLLEVIAATILIGVAIAPALNLVQKQTSATRWSTERLHAVQLANHLLEYYQVRGGYAFLFPILGGFGAGLRHDSMSGPGGYNSPNQLNPVLGGPRVLANADEWWNPTDGATRQTLENVYRFQRRVEIFGGQSYAPFPNAGAMAPVNCYMVRVTISTEGSGTMMRPQDQYQVVTLFAQ